MYCTNNKLYIVQFNVDLIRVGYGLQAWMSAISKSFRLWDQFSRFCGFLTEKWNEIAHVVYVYCTHLLFFTPKRFRSLTFSLSFSPHINHRSAKGLHFRAETETLNDRSCLEWFCVWPKSFALRMGKGQLSKKMYNITCVDMSYFPPRVIHMYVTSIETFPKIQNDKYLHT